MAALKASAVNATISIDDISKWEKLSTDSLYQLAKNYMDVQNMPDSALLCFTVITNRYYDRTPKGRDRQTYATALQQTGILYFYYYGDLYKAQTYFLQAQEAAERLNVPEVLLRIYVSQANLYLADYSIREKNPNFMPVIDMYKKAFVESIRTRQETPLQPIIINLVQVAFGDQKMEQAWDIVEQYDKMQIAPDAYMGAYAKQLCKAMLLWRVGRTDSAVHLIETIPIGEEIPLRQRQQIKIIKNDILYHANLYLGNNEKALSHIWQEVHLAEQEQDATALTDAYRYLFEFYTHINDTKQAEKCELQWLRCKDEAINRTRVSEMKDAEFLMDISKLNDQMKSLSQQRQTQQRILIIVSLFLLLTLAMIAMLVSNFRRLKRSHRALYEKNLELLEAEEQRLKAEEQQRAKAEKVKYGTSRLDEETSSQLLEQVMDFLHTSDEIYQESFTIARMAELLGVNQNYISQAINARGEQSFKSLLGEFRIKEACRRMQDNEKYANYTVEGIGQSVGFSSRPYFVQLFKKLTGLTPSAYQKMAKERT
ncbi:MAG: helix-turn-helix transcriptional regulator [Muribaculaceae bacterium]|nr:helix-turn-helix transcriptional regulator [Muribaculaceae bacterium]